MSKYLSSLSGRLTLWYAGVFSLSFIALFGTFSFIIHRHIHQWTIEQLKEEAVEIRMAYTESGLPEIVRLLRMEEASEKGRFMGRVLDRNRTVIYETASEDWARVKFNPDFVADSRDGLSRIEVVTVEPGESVYVIYRLLPDGSVVQIGLPLLEHEAWMEQFSRKLLQVAGLALLLSVGAGGFMARRALRPIGEMAKLASEISGRSLGRRMPVSGTGDEVDQLAQSFNGMLERIDTLVRGMREVTDVLAHDLKTPLTSIKGIAEVTLQSHRCVETYRLSLYRIVEHLDRLLGIFHSILDVSEAEGGALALRRERVQLDELSRDIVQTFAPVAEDKGIRLDACIASGLSVEGDRSRLFQALANLLDNAVKYTPTGGVITLSCEKDPTGAGAVITVSDTGAGISPEDLPHIFERYYRGDRSRSGSGLGLGLPLVQGIVHAHGGRITTESLPGKGAVFRLFLGTTV